MPPSSSFLVGLVLLASPPSLPALFFQADERDLNSELQIAAREGRTLEVVRLVRKGANPNSRGLTDTPLTAAVRGGHRETADRLLDLWADPDLRHSECDDSPLELAIYGGHLGIVEDLIAHNADIDAADCEGKSTLSIAAIMGNVEIATTLLNLRVDVDQRDSSGSSPLFHAVMFGRIEVASLLLKRGADPNAVNLNPKKNSPLMLALDLDPESAMKMTSLLLEGGADPNLQNAEQGTALQRAVRTGKWRVAHLLFSEGASVTLAFPLLIPFLIGLSGLTLIFMAICCRCCCRSFKRPTVKVERNVLTV